MPTKIEWAEETWNPVTGCTPVSEGCQNCYAEHFAKRLAGRFGYPKDDPFRVIHPDVPDEFIYNVWDIMVLCREHTFLVLTKRPERMKSFVEKVMANRLNYAYTLGDTEEGAAARKWARKPVSNIWLGVSAENQQTANERIPVLLQIPAAVRFVSVEPMLGPVDLSRWVFGWDPITGEHSLSGYCDMPGDKGVPGLNWIIIGAQTGPGAKPPEPEWVKAIINQARAADIPVYLKDNLGWPEPIQEFPEDGRA